MMEFHLQKTLAVKLLRSEILTTKRTVAGRRSISYLESNDEKHLRLGASPLSPDGFRFELQYRDDQTGVSSNTLQNADSQSTDGSYQTTFASIQFR